MNVVVKAEGCRCKSYLLHHFLRALEVLKNKILKLFDSYEEVEGCRDVHEDVSYYVLDGGKHYGVFAGRGRCHIYSNKRDFKRAGGILK